MGLIASMVAGAAMEGGKAGEEVGGEFLKANFAADLKRQEALIQEQRDARLQESAKEIARYNDDLKRAPAKEAMAKIEEANKPVWVEDGVGGGMKQAPTKAEQRANERKAYMASGDSGLIQAAVSSEGHDIQREGQAKQERMGERQIASQEKLSADMRASQERIAGMHASIQKQIAEMGSTIQVLDNGEMVAVSKDGKVKDYVRDPTTGEHLTSKKNLSDGDRALAMSLVAENKGQEALAKDINSTAEQKSSAIAQIKSNTAELYRITGRDMPKETFQKPTAQDQADFEKRKGDPKQAGFVAAYEARFGPQKAANPVETKAGAKPGLIDARVTEAPVLQSEWQSKNALRIAARQAEDNASEAKKLDTEISMARKEIDTLPLKGPADVARRARLAKLEADRSKIKD